MGSSLQLEGHRPSVWTSRCDGVRRRRMGCAKGESERELHSIEGSALILLHVMHLNLLTKDEVLLLRSHRLRRIQW